MSDTKTITTPIGKKEVVLKTWISGREKRELRKPYLSGFQFSLEEDKTKAKNITGEMIENAENKAIEIIVVSVDGEKKDKLNRLLDLDSRDYDFVIKEVNKVSSEVGFTKQ